MFNLQIRSSGLDNSSGENESICEFTASCVENFCLSGSDVSQQSLDDLVCCATALRIRCPRARPRTVCFLACVFSLHLGVLDHLQRLWMFSFLDQRERIHRRRGFLPQELIRAAALGVGGCCPLCSRVRWALYLTVVMCLYFCGGILEVTGMLARTSRALSEFSTIAAAPASVDF